MKKIISITILICWFSSLLSQPLTVGKPTQLVTSSGQAWVNPQWSPDGSLIAFSSEGFKGIWVIDNIGNQMRQISSEDGVGFGFSWSPNSEKILVRSSEYVGTRRFQSIKTINVVNSEVATLVEPTRGIKSLPMWVSGGSKVLAVINESPELLSVGGNDEPPSSNIGTDGFIYAIEDKLMYGYHSKSESQEVSNFESRTIFNVTTSPSGQKIAFQVSARGLYVVDADGTGLQHLGYGERPSWFPGEDYLAIMKTTDDGYNFTSGAINAVCVSTGKESPLVDIPGIIALSPSVSADGKQMAFENHTSGDILIVNLKN